MGHFVFPMFSQLSKEQKYCITSLQEKEKKQSKPTQVLSGLLSLFLNYFCAKIKCISAALTVVSFAANVWSRLIESSLRVIAWHDQITITKETMLTAIPQQKQNQNYLSLVNRLKIIIPCNFIAKSRLKLMYLQ